MNLIIDSSNFLLDSPGFSIHRIMLSMNRDRFTSHLTVWIPFMSCLCVNTLVRTSNAMFSISGKTFHFSQLHMMSVVTLSWKAFIMVCMCRLGLFGPRYSSNATFSCWFWVGNLSIVESEVLKFPTITVLLSIFPFRFVSICLIYLGAPMLAGYMNNYTTLMNWSIIHSIVT